VIIPDTGQRPDAIHQYRRVSRQPDYFNILTNKDNRIHFESRHSPGIFQIPALGEKESNLAIPIGTSLSKIAILARESRALLGSSNYSEASTRPFDTLRKVAFADH
jgi:hypothetical protein